MMHKKFKGDRMCFERPETLGESAEQWCHERGENIPPAESKAWSRMYSEFCHWIGKDGEVSLFVHLEPGEQFRDTDGHLWTKQLEFTCIDAKGKTKLFPLYTQVVRIARSKKSKRKEVG